MTSFPDCFDSEQEYESWAELAELDTELVLPRLSYCIDCLPWYQSVMIKQGRCAYPDYVPRLEIDDGQQSLPLS